MNKDTRQTEKRALSPRHLATLLAASPEGYFHHTAINDSKLGAGSRAEVIRVALEEGIAALCGDYLYDPTRLSAETVAERSALYPGSLPPLKMDGKPAVRPITERMHIRRERLDALADEALNRIVALFEGTAGYLPYAEVCTGPEDDSALSLLSQYALIKRWENLIYDPLRISKESVMTLHERQVVMPVRDQIVALLAESAGQTLARAALVERFGAKLVIKSLELGGLAQFSVQAPLGESFWLRLAEGDPALALQTAEEAVRPKDEDWLPLLTFCGDVLRPDAEEFAEDSPDTIRAQAIARSYLTAEAARKLQVRETTLQAALDEKHVAAMTDPEGKLRVPVGEIEAVLASPNWLQLIQDMETIHIRDLKLAFGEAEARNLVNGLRRLGGKRLRWGALRSLLAGTPEAGMTLPQFYDRIRAGRVSQRAMEADRRAEEKRQRDEDRRRRDEDRRQRDALRARLLAAFPTWQHPGRADQRVQLHVGPTNSGKTHDALEALIAAGTGWYLAPLRLLAYEIFDRMNRRGVYCNLLTGEEYIPVPGATITAATIEMFSPQHSGSLVVVDEAHMLADSDRGWAWTRALMEAQAPEIRVIAPPFARELVERLVGAAAIPLRVVEHQRLAPLQVSSKPWTLEHMPEKTILVAFSRRMVLRLKTELEKYQRRVSVIYGSLPPEVRRRQADRFALGETEICVATDAVGMGLNLPADNVCFFELEKFDGKTIRPLTSAEVHQIGGRAGRYGFSAAGLIGATTRVGLRQLRNLYETAPDTLDRARVAPVVEDLELIPGNLAHRFAQWRELQSIPESLRDVIEPADIDERIALAQMLSDHDVEKLGLGGAVQLVNAPTRESSRQYWLKCARAIIAEEDMPLPPEAPMDIESDFDLEATESAIACADIYLWLGSRREFSGFGTDEPWVRSLRAEWSLAIDAALLRKLDTAARCINCRAKLPLGHRYSLCDQCYHANRSGWWR